MKIPVTKAHSTKTSIKNLFLLPALIAGLGLISAGRVTAQTFTNLHTFTGVSDGANPQAGLMLSGNTLYGTAQYGGSLGYGTVFAININGTGFTNLHNFDGPEGVYPTAGLVLLGSTLYGTVQNGGSWGNGTVFAVNTDGTGFMNLHHFGAFQGDGAYPYAGLVLSGSTLYGTAFNGGGTGSGTVFAVNTAGTVYTNLHQFLLFPGDGANPFAGLTLSGATLYGTAKGGVNTSAKGTVFKLNTDGTGYTNLYTFTGGSDGATPFGQIILSGSTLYGTAYDGGSAHFGTVFAVSTDGTGFTILHSFAGFNDGIHPYGGLILSGNTLFGTASQSGSSSQGTVFKVKTNGTGYANLHSFSGVSEGSNPYGALIFSGNTLYGTAYQGGSSSRGAIFSLSLPSPPQLTITGSAANVILTWPTNAIGFTLESTTSLVPPVVWTTVSPLPVVVNGQNAVTNPVSGTKTFYRLDF